METSAVVPVQLLTVQALFQRKHVLMVQEIQVPFQDNAVELHQETQAVAHQTTATAHVAAAHQATVAVHQAIQAVHSHREAAVHQAASAVVVATVVAAVVAVEDVAKNSTYTVLHSDSPQVSLTQT
jgi:hypothetical protein